MRNRNLNDRVLIWMTILFLVPACYLFQLVTCWGPYTHAAFSSIYLTYLKEEENNHHKQHNHNRSDPSSSPSSSSRTSSLHLLRRRRGGCNQHKGQDDNNNDDDDDDATMVQEEEEVEAILEAVFVTAAAYPDAFKKNRHWMHSFEYAVFQLEQAALWKPTTNNNNNNNTTTIGSSHGTKESSSWKWKTSLDLIHTDAVKAFSFGYLVHLLEDYVGHHKGGYLDVLKNYGNDHWLEFHVDTMMYVLHRHDKPPWQFDANGGGGGGGMNVLLNNPQIRKEVTTFVSQTSQHYYATAAASSSFPAANNNNRIITRTNKNIENEQQPQPHGQERERSEQNDDNHDTKSGGGGGDDDDGRGGINVQQVERSMRQFSALLRTESKAMLINSKTYQRGMIRFDVCHAKTFQDANRTLGRTIQYWIEPQQHYVGGVLDVFQRNLFPWSSLSLSTLQNATSNTSGGGKAFKKSLVLSPDLLPRHHKNTNKVQTASTVARDWVDATFQQHGGTICVSSTTGTTMLPLV